MIAIIIILLLICGIVYCRVNSPPRKGLLTGTLWFLFYVYVSVCMTNLLQVIMQGYYNSASGDLKCNVVSIAIFYPCFYSVLCADLLAQVLGLPVGRYNRCRKCVYPLYHCDCVTPFRKMRVLSLPELYLMGAKYWYAACLFRYHVTSSLFVFRIMSSH